MLKQWTKSIEIDASIEKVWDLFDGSGEKMMKIMPQVVEHKPIKITDEVVGSVYRQKYKEGKRIEEYDVTTLEHLDTADDKKLKVGFTLANFFEITACYELKRLSQNKTLFTYTATNQALKWFVNLFLMFANDKIVREFVERVKKEVEMGEIGTPV